MARIVAGDSLFVGKGGALFDILEGATYRSQNNTFFVVMHIYLVRHLEYENPDGIYPYYLPLKLSNKGINDAYKIASWFIDKQLNGILIYTSPIARCVQTANIIATKTNSPVINDQRLIEIFCSNLQGKKWIIPNPWLEEDDSTRETRESTRNRIVSIFNEKIMKNKNCIFVSHGEPLTILYYYLRKQKLPTYLWDPVVSQQVIQKGDVVDVAIENEKVISVNKTTIAE